MMGLIGLTVLDISINKILLLFPIDIAVHNYKNFFFILESSLIILCQSFALYFLKTNINKNYPGHDIKNKFNLFFIAQLMIIVSILYTIYEIVFFKSYSSNILLIIFSTSYITSLILSFSTTKLFFKWVSVNKIPILLSYAFSIAILFINTLISITLIDLSVINLPERIFQHDTSSYVPFFTDLTKFVNLDNLINYFTIATFCSWWISTFILIHNYSLTIGKIRFWVIITLPLIYFIIPFVTNIISFIPIDWVNLYFTVASFNKIFGGLLFGLSFWFIVKKLNKDSFIRKYLSLSAIGLTLIFISNQSLIVLNIPFPPFGLAGISIISLGNLLFLYGMSFCVIHLTYDIQMKDHIKKITKEEVASTGFLYEIRYAESTKKLEKKVNTISKKYLIEMDNTYKINNSFLNEKSVSDYINTVLEELQTNSKKEK